MAETKNLTFLLILFTIFSISTLTTTAKKTNRFARVLSPAELGLGLKAGKITHLHFYFHDMVDGKNVTSVRVAEAPVTKTSPSLFGVVNVIDDPLTVSSKPNSERVGSAQGSFAGASQTEIAFATTVNFVFTSGKFNGSTLSVIGRNNIIANIRELPIVGGTGLFRFARGYAQAHTYRRKGNNAIVEYNVYVYH